ncbi:MAG: HAD hydrolase-like protein, partial [Propionibacteriaceae bacterium]|nr:HAD hydrolase-like protein [Propionibacteriaceae bacterium]
DETIRRLRTRNLIMVGDRLDTDIAGARRAGLDSLLVLSGSHGKADLCAARADERPTWLASDVSGLLTPGRQAVIEPGQVRCRSVTAKVSGGVIELDSIPSDRDGQVDALWAVANLVWTTDTSVAEPVIDWWTVIATLDLVP